MQRQPLRLPLLRPPRVERGARAALEPDAAVRARAPPATAVSSRAAPPPPLARPPSPTPPGPPARPAAAHVVGQQQEYIRAVVQWRHVGPDCADRHVPRCVARRHGRGVWCAAIPARYGVRQCATPVPPPGAPTCGYARLFPNSASPSLPRLAPQATRSGDACRTTARAARRGRTATRGIAPCPSRETRVRGAVAAAAYS